MKKLFLLALIALSAIAISSCKKSNPAPVVSNQWTIDGSTFNNVDSGIQGGDTLYAVDDHQNELWIAFGQAPVPGTYAVVNWIANITGTVLTTTQCDIYAIREDPSFLPYTSNGGSGNTVKVTVTGGKITATFSNIIMTSDLGVNNIMLSGSFTQK